MARFVKGNYHAYRRMEQHKVKHSGLQVFLIILGFITFPLGIIFLIMSAGVKK